MLFSHIGNFIVHSPAEFSATLNRRILYEQKKSSYENKADFSVESLTAAMLLGQTGAVFAEATDSADAGSPTPTPDPHTEYYAQTADTDSIEGWPEGPRLRRSQQFSWI